MLDSYTKMVVPCTNISSMGNHCTAFEYLQSLAVPIMTEVKDKVLPTQEWSGLAFYSDSILFATKTSFVEAVIPFEYLYPLPMHLEGFIGMSSHRDKIFAVLDLKALFWKKNSVYNADSRIIICRYQEQRIGVLVCRCLGLRRFNLSTKTQVELSQQVPYQRFVKHLFYAEEKRFAVLDMAKLFGEIQIGNLIKEEKK
ncbi:MAG: chemotaxis protein CheW [Candidatus Berkiella sp.]